jgi:hypothetical protein
MLLMMSVLIAGCVNLDHRLMVPDRSVTPINTGYDCTYMIVLPIFIGTNTAEKAMANAGREVPAGRSSNGLPTTKFLASPITKVHSIELQQRATIFYSEVCIQVKGE